MRIATTILALLVLVTASGCRLSGTNKSPQGGILPVNEEFSITVPNSSTVKQGAELIVTVALNRGPYFKQDVVLAVHTEGIGVTPDRVTVRASDLPVVRLRVLVPREAAIGMYRVSVVGMPQAGRTASTEFTVEVVPQ